MNRQRSHGGCFAIRHSCSSFAIVRRPLARRGHLCVILLVLPSCRPGDGQEQQSRGNLAGN